MRKVTAVALSFAMMGALLTGCGSGKAEEKVTVKVGALKGATTLGLLPLEDKAANGEAGENYEFSMMTAADELLPMMIKGELDIALLPSNVSEDQWRCDCYRYQYTWRIIYGIRRFFRYRSGRSGRQDNLSDR